MDSVLSKTGSTLSRRTFLGASAAAAASLALAGCAPQAKLEKTGKKEDGFYRVDEEFNPENGGKWVTALCDNNCGGMCLN
ncbi:MAG: twin-arginine translocation signal domain-containing protein, partial [Raoultibacter sp.]